LGPQKTLVGCVLLLAVMGAACSSSSKRSRALAPLVASSWRVELELKNFAPAVVAVPLGATTPRPIAVIIHGARDRAEWQCGSFRGVLGGNAFVVCPRGMLASAEGSLYGLGSFDENAAELRAALAALKARFGAHVGGGPVVLVGYAEGAAMAADLARQEPSFFARVALVKGDPSTLSSTGVKVFAERGGKRMLFFCASPECLDAGAERARWLTGRGVAAKAVQAAVGPYFDPAFADALSQEIPWLVEGDARWSRRRR